VSGTLVGTARTGLVVVGFVALLSGIVTLAYPPLLVGYVTPGEPEGLTSPGETSERGTNNSATLFGPTTQTSLVGIIWGLTLVAVGLAIPGRSSFGIDAQSSFTRKQRIYTLVGAVLVIVVPLAVGLLIQTTGQYVIAIFPAGFLAIIGGILVLLGGSRGLA